MIRKRKKDEGPDEEAVRLPHSLVAKSCAEKNAIAARLKRARELLNLERPEFAQKLNSSVSAIGDYERGRSAPGAEVLAGLARLGVNVHWLLTDDGPPLLKGAAAAAHADAIDFFMVPRYDVDAGAGAGKVIERESEIGRLAFRKDWIQQKGLSAKDLVVIRISGDSMEPTVRHGSLVLVDSSQDKVVQDGIYVLMLDSHLVAKRLQVDFAGGVYVRSDNLAYREQHLTADQAEAIRIVGRVVWAGSEL